MKYVEQWKRKNVIPLNTEIPVKYKNFVFFDITLFPF